MVKNISVIGIGKLGLCFALTLEKQGYSVVGVDVSEEYIRMVNDKTLISPEPGLENDLKQSKNLTATTDVKKGLDHSDVLFLFVATPSLPNGRYDHKQIDRVVKHLIQYSSPSKTKHIIPVNLSKKNLNKVMNVALKAHKLIGCRGVTRSDFKYFQNKFYLLETNTQPGMTKLSLVPEIANYVGMTFIELIEWILKDGSIKR